MGTELDTSSTIALSENAAKPKTESPTFSSPGKLRLILSLVLIVFTLAIYNPVVHNGFLNLDDNVYLINNTQVHSGLTLDTVKWAFTTYTADNWHPLTWISHALDWELFGRNTAGHHYVSLLFHALNAVLLFLLLEKVTGFTWRSLFVAALFALHPVNVESVAWAAERKNVLSMMFFLLGMIAYGWYAKRPSSRRYGLVALSYVLGLLAKPQVITFPCVLLLWDYWPLQRFGSRKDTATEGEYAPASFWRLVVEKVPLFVLAAADALVTMRAQRNPVHYGHDNYGFVSRVANALVSYARYIGHAFWPMHLSPTYPHPKTLPVWEMVASGAFLLLITGLAFAVRKRYLLVGWLWYLGILVPMIGIIQVGDQAMADRYAYIPFIGLFWIVAWSAAELCADWKVSTRWLAVPAMLAIAGASFITSHQITYWHDSETLWRYALAVTPERNFMAHSYLAGILTLENRHDEAMKEYVAAEQYHDYPLTQVVYFADYELRHQHVAEAIVDAQRVIAGTNDPTAREMAFRVLGIAYTQLAKSAEARDNYEQALKIEPRDPYALMGLGLLAYRESDFSTATEYFSRTVAVDPSDFDYLLLANALERAGRGDQASTAYKEAQRVSTNWDEAQKKAHWFLTN
jgi:protein O-mannosyl-transferase